MCITDALSTRTPKDTVGRPPSQEAELCRSQLAKLQADLRVLVSSTPALWLISLTIGDLTYVI